MNNNNNQEFQSIKSHRLWLALEASLKRSTLAPILIEFFHIYFFFERHDLCSTCVPLLPCNMIHICRVFGCFLNIFMPSFMPAHFSLHFPCAVCSFLHCTVLFEWIYFSSIYLFNQFFQSVVLGRFGARFMPCNVPLFTVLQLWLLVVVSLVCKY